MTVKHFEFLGKKIRPIELSLLLKVILNIKRNEFKLPDGRIYFIDPISDFGIRIQRDLEYEPDMSAAILSLLSDGDTFIDLGSNEGYFSVLASRQVGEKGKVFSIEPQERLWQIILKNTSINFLRNVYLIPFGIGAKAAKTKMQLYPSINSGASGFANNYNFKVSFSKLRRWFYGTQHSNILTLDDLIHAFPADVKLLKIDIEGYEFEALKGSQKLLSKGQLKNILVEIHPEVLKRLGQGEKDIDDLMSKNLYSKRKISENLNLYHI